MRKERTRIFQILGRPCSFKGTALVKKVISAGIMFLPSCLPASSTFFLHCAPVHHLSTPSKMTSSQLIINRVSRTRMAVDLLIYRRHTDTSHTTSANIVKNEGDIISLLQTKESFTMAESTLANERIVVKPSTTCTIHLIIGALNETTSWKAVEPAPSSGTDRYNAAKWSTAVRTKPANDQGGS